MQIVSLHQFTTSKGLCTRMKCFKPSYSHTRAHQDEYYMKDMFIVYYFSTLSSDVQKKADLEKMNLTSCLTLTLKRQKIECVTGKEYNNPNARDRMNSFETLS